MSQISNLSSGPQITRTDKKNEVFLHRVINLYKGAFGFYVKFILIAPNLNPGTICTKNSASIEIQKRVSSDRNYLPASSNSE
jgi:hypothetical protein